MTDVPEVGSLIGPAVMIILAGIPSIGGYFTIKAKLDQLGRRSEKGEKQHEENQARMNSIELQIAKDCVKVDDFRRLDDRMTARFEKVEHIINNSALKTVQMVKEAVRDMLPPRRTEP